MHVVANGISTFFEESNGFITEPGSPYFCYLIVDIVAPCWQLVFGVKVMISQSSIYFSIWEGKEKHKNIYMKALGGAISHLQLASVIRAKRGGGRGKSTDEEKTEIS